MAIMLEQLGLAAGHRASSSDVMRCRETMMPRVLALMTADRRLASGRIVLFRDLANPRVLEDVIRGPRPES
jgi:hypothetical protein